MAITGQTLVIQPVGAPSLGPAGAFVQGPGDAQVPTFYATFTFVGDGTITTVPVNWIDGTQTLPFTPRAVLAFAIPPLTGSASTTGVLQAEGSYAAPRVTSISNTSCSVVYSTVVANNSSASVLLVVYK